MTVTVPPRPSLIARIITSLLSPRVAAKPVALVFATLGFSYALATSPAPSTGIASSRGDTAKSRTVLSKPLRFTNPFLLPGADSTFPNGGDVTDDPDGFDLGDACANTMFVRYVSATGGFQPYSFTLKPLLGSQNNSVNGGGVATPQLPNLTPSGQMNGVLPAGFLRFNILLSDFIGTQRLGTFRLNVMDCSPAVLATQKFRFGMDQLPAAQMGNDYFTRLGTVYGSDPVSFSVVPGSVVVGTTPFKTLEEAGLTLGKEGTLFGRPVKTGDIAFQVAATDAGGVAAYSRNGLVLNQAFVLHVNTGIAVSSQLTAMHCSLSGAKNMIGKDSFSYMGFLDPKGETLSTLAGTQFTLRIGSQPLNTSNVYGALFSGTFDAKGNVAGKSGKHVVVYTPSNGLIKINLKDADIAGNVGVSGFANKTNQTVILAVEIGEPQLTGVTKTAIRTCEVLKMAARITSQGKFSLAYALGTVGYSRAGAFQVVGLTGSDVTISKDDSGDAWVVRFIGFPGQDADVIPAAPTPKGKKTPPTPTAFGQPPAAGTALKAATSVTISIGDGFSQGLTLTPLAVRLQFRATNKDAGIFRFRLDPSRFVHELVTNAISQNDTGISTAIDTKDVTVFPLEMDFTGFSGETGRIIAPNRGAWTPR